MRRDAAAADRTASRTRARAVRARAAFALGSVQDPGAVRALMRALSDTVAAVRRDAAFALGQAGAPRRVAPLAAALRRREGRRRCGTASWRPWARSAPSEAAHAPPGARRARRSEADRALALAVSARCGGIITRATPRLPAGPARRPRPAGARRTRRTTSGGSARPARGPRGRPRVREALDAYPKDDPAAMYLVQALGRLARPLRRGAPRGLGDHGPDWRIAGQRHGRARRRGARRRDAREALMRGARRPVASTWP